MTAVFWASVFLLVTISFCEDEPIVEIPNGKLRGKFNGNFYEFKSIPYAEPPVGKNRFEPPKPYTKKWEHCRDATKTPNNCMQWDFLLFQEDLLHGEEDCLYLNVFTPSICGDELYPVIVHIHGGAFMFGSGDLYGPGILLSEKKFVLVNFNYRLGPLGFLSTGDSKIPGNMGLKDQQLVLKWVKEYIKLFKGDPDRITLTGWSAGSASVNFQLFAEQNEGLFHAAISHSGTAHSSWAQVHDPLKKANILADYIGCPTNSTKKLKKCLKRKPAEDIVRAVKILQTFYYQPLVVFGPVVEPKSSKEPFINEEYIDFMKNSKITKVPWIVTYTTEEGGFDSAYLLRKDENNVEIINNNFDEKWDELAPFMLFFYETVPKEKQSACAEELKHRYLGDEQFSVDNYMQVQKMFTDQIFLNGVEDAIKFHRDNIDSPVYVYQYEKSPRYSFGNLVSENDDYDFGAVHGVDIVLIYETPIFPSAGFDDGEKQISQYFTSMYETFARDGVPVYGNTAIPQNEANSNEIKLLVIRDVENYEVITVDKIVEPIDPAGSCVNQYLLP